MQRGFACQCIPPDLKPQMFSSEDSQCLKDGLVPLMTHAHGTDVGVTGFHLYITWC